MRKFSNKMVLSILTLVLLVVALGTTTYAWFTVGNIAKVDQFTTEVSSGHGLEIVYVDSGDVERGGYKSAITSTDMHSYLHADYAYGDGTWSTKFQLGAVTSTDGLVFKKLNTSDNYATLVAANKKTDGFVEFKLRFRTKAENAKLVWNSVTLNSTGVQWTPETSFTGVGGATISSEATYYAKNATRISVNAGATTKVYELPSTADPDFSNTQLSNNSPNFTQGAHNYFQKMTGVNLSTAHSTYTAVTTVTTLDDGIVIGDINTVKDGYNTITVTIRIYLEGFDSETFNAILKDQIQVALGFTMQ